MELRVKRAPHIDMEITVPGDKSISHRAAIIAALSNGICRLNGFLMGDDCLRTVNALRALGIRIDEPEPDTIVVHGKRRVLNAPTDEIDCGNSATTMRLMAGLTRRPNIRKPADWRCFAFQASNGARHRAVAADGRKHYGGRSLTTLRPCAIRGGLVAWNSLRNANPSAQVKSAVLLAGLFAKGKTSIVEEIQTRDHTERMMRYFFVRTTREENGTISIFGDQVPESRDFRIPGDLSSATYWLAAAAAQPGGHLLVRHVGLNTTRTPVLGVLVRMGAQVREAIEDVDQLEPHGIVEVTGAMLKGTVIQGKEVAQLIDELPVLAVAGALAIGTTIIRQAQELRVKETDRIAAIAHNLRVMGRASD
jgi:3-phosphoshikimate 1-carboxyvinyltransferase